MRMRVRHALAIERAMRFRLAHEAFALVEHLHVAAERDRRDRPLGLVRARGGGPTARDRIPPRKRRIFTPSFFATQ
jgi:hypothetical protein